MSAPGRPKRESFERQREGSPVTALVLRASGVASGDAWRIVRGADAPVDAGAVLPLATWLALGQARRAQHGLWLAPADDPLALRCAALPARIAVDFPTFKDGRGYSTATLLRTRLAFAGDLRAIGDVLVDQLFYLKRVGFSSFELRAAQDPAAAAAALRTFSDAYQRATDNPLPLFRRRLSNGVPT
jgi:uncharacterized protein (DUF934 family)